ncbi:restriction endonuclease [Desulfocurvibacter africanus]|uniref:Restriction endonuclease n=1 Tax=Desulfocurvibacter africanus subsp. africanus str. Walvis Bay TaxID=690850 RepID=F3YXG1_DESAF|nr:restriction endonuclease [Desulfocurvibacter africanus]EGJ51738.1 restriction endonuclease [Desulfocurvibacter africanus subsp. africanus str. Walvis Bay]
MPIPDFQTIMLPLLELSSDGKVRSSAEYRDTLADRFTLTPAEREELLPSGKQQIFSNRVSWASFYLQRAGLLTKPRRGHYQITERGREALRTRPQRINIEFLQQYPEFNAFREKSTDKKPVEETRTGETPEETLETAFQQMRGGLALEILEQVKSCTPQFFERLVVELLVGMGYGGTMHDAGMAVGKSGDEGIDGIIKEDRLGLDLIYLQAKRWEGTVGRPEVQKFVGALHGKHARKGVFITTGTFAQGAVEYAASIDSKVVLIDGKRLAELMIEFDVGVSTKATYQVKRIDSDYFNEE